MRSKLRLYGNRFLDVTTDHKYVFPANIKTVSLFVFALPEFVNFIDFHLKLTDLRLRAEVWSDSCSHSRPASITTNSHMLRQPRTGQKAAITSCLFFGDSKHWVTLTPKPDWQKSSTGLVIIGWLWHKKKKTLCPELALLWVKGAHVHPRSVRCGLTDITHI